MLNILTIIESPSSAFLKADKTTFSPLIETKESSALKSPWSANIGVFKLYASS